jgi:hypothetical protein
MPGQILRRSYIWVIIIFLFAVIAFAADTTIVLFGKQTKRGQLASAKLESGPIELSQSARIAKVRGGKAGFWISRKQGLRTEIVRQFRSPQEAVGTVLEPGLYVAYPLIPDGAQEETVTVYLGSGADTQRKSSASAAALKTFSSTVHNYYDKIPSASGSQRNELCRQAIAGFAAVIEVSCPKAIVTRKLAAYYQAQCYRELQDSQGYRAALEKCLSLLPEPKDNNIDTLSMVMSLHIATQQELDALK